VIFHSSHFTVYSYGVMMGMGTLLAIVWLVHLAAREDIAPAKVEGLGLVIVFCAVVGSKLLTALDYPGFYAGEWSRLWDQGGVFYGGFVLAVVATAIYMRLADLPGWRVADCVVPGLALAQGLGRIGCFFAGCCWGTTTHLPFGVTFTSGLAHSITGVPLYQKLHPTQLYEAALVLLAIPFLLRLSKSKSFDGEVVLAYVLYYAIVRFLLEFFRGDPRGYYFNGLLSTSQIISLVIIPIATLLLVGLQKQAALANQCDRTTPRMLVRKTARARAY
jgi:phosphatidylglycerol:prolipoprotein diacylglycerol transferase